MSHHWINEPEEALVHYERALDTAVDPYYRAIPLMTWGICQAQLGNFQQAEESLRQVEDFGFRLGCEMMGHLAQGVLGMVLMGQGQMGKGLEIMEEKLEVMRQSDRVITVAMMELNLGRIYLQIVDKSAAVSLPMMAKNLGFILKSVPRAGHKAEALLLSVVEGGQNAGALGLAGQAQYELGALYRTRGKKHKAYDYFSDALETFNRLGLDRLAAKAQEALAGLG